MKTINQKTLSIFDEIINLSWLSHNEKLILKIARAIVADRYRSMKTMITLVEITEKLSTDITKVATDVAKIKGAKDVEDLKAKVESITKNLVTEAIQSPIIIGKLISQEILGNFYGNVVQANHSQVNFNQQVTGAFKQANEQVEKKTEVSVEQKEEIKKILKILEEELLNNEKDAGKIQKAWDWLKRNAEWLVPTLTQVVLEGIKIAIDIS